MIRLLAAIARAIAGLIKFPFDFLNYLFGGGYGPAAPVPDIEAVMPDLGVLDAKIDQAKGEQAALDWSKGISPEHQTRLYASATEDERYAVDLDLLSFSQQQWLTGLTADQLTKVAVANDRQIADAFAGLPLSIPLTPSVGYKEPELVAPTLAGRISAYRAGNLGSAELNYVMH